MTNTEHKKEIMKPKYVCLKYSQAVSILTIMLLLNAGCGIFGSDDSFVVPFDPSFACTNSEPETWSYLGVPGEMILSIAINPHNAGHMLVGTSGNVRGNTPKLNDH